MDAEAGGMRDSTSLIQQHSDRVVLADEVDTLGTEDVLLRNYDHQWGYDLNLEVFTPVGDAVFEKQYYLPPGHVASELEAVAAGEYEVRATLDNGKQANLECAIDAHPDRTLVVEVGNGVMSLTEGLHS
jgi:hypothetical protein